MAYASQLQDDFSGGMYRGRRAPANAAYDIVNGLINDEGQPYRRAGSAYKSNADAGTALTGLADFTLPSGPVTLMWSDTAVYALDVSDDATPTADLLTPVTGHPPRALARGAGVGDAWYAPSSVASTNQIIKVTKAGASNPSTSNQTVPSAGASYVTAVGSPARLIVTWQNRAYFSNRGDAATIDSDSYHELPQNAQIIGADSIGDTCVLFTTAGVWTISNMALDPVDAYGDIQHVVQQISKDVTLWGDSGIAGWKGALLVPGTDDVMILGLDGSSQTITGGRFSQYDGGIRNLYREYVQAGYEPGIASVHRGHLFLPVVVPSVNVLVDVLVCRLDHGFAWSRFNGHPACVGYATRIGATTRTPKLLGIRAERVVDISPCMDPGVSTDADDAERAFIVETRDFPTGQQPGIFAKVRARYELDAADDDDPAVTAFFTSDQDAGSFSALTDKGEQNGGAGWSASDGSLYQWATVGKRRERGRFRLSVGDTVDRFVLRSIEVLSSPSGKQ